MSVFDPNTVRLQRELMNLINTGKRDPQEPDANGQRGGREYAHSLYPNEIEFYACALELVDGEDQTTDFFVLPVMPSSYTHTEISQASIDKTMAGVVVVNNPTFIPFDIVMSGTFGRRFKRIETRLPENSVPGRVSEKAIVVDRVFDYEYKTGYGCYKILEDLFRRAQKTDSFYNPNKLFFYNLSLNHQYLVEPISLSPSQSQSDSSGTWNYSLTIKTIAPASAVNKNYKSSLKLLTDYSNITKVAIFQSEEIKKYKERNKTMRQKSAVEKVIERQVKGRTFGVLDTKTQSAIQALFELAQDAEGRDDFLINVGEGILNTRF